MRNCARSLAHLPAGRREAGQGVQDCRGELGPGRHFGSTASTWHEKYSEASSQPFIKGFVVIRSSTPLRITGVYTAAGVDRQGEIELVTSIDVVEIRLAKSKVTGGQCPDLTVTDISGLSVSCPGGPGTCVTKFDYTVRNIGLGDAFAQIGGRSVAEPAASVIVDRNSSGRIRQPEWRRRSRSQRRRGVIASIPSCTIYGDGRHR